MVAENQKLLVEMMESLYTFGANLSFLPLAAVLSATYPEAGFAFQISASLFLFAVQLISFQAAPVFLQFVSQLFVEDL